MLKIAVLAPIPRARVSNVATVNIGVRARRRAACRTSRIRSNIGFPPDWYVYALAPIWFTLISEDLFLPRAPRKRCMRARPVASVRIPSRLTIRRPAP